MTICCFGRSYCSQRRGTPSDASRIVLSCSSTTTDRRLCPAWPFHQRYLFVRLLIVNFRWQRTGCSGVRSHRCTCLLAAVHDLRSAWAADTVVCVKPLLALHGMSISLQLRWAWMQDSSNAGQWTRKWYYAAPQLARPYGWTFNPYSDLSAFHRPLLRCVDPAWQYPAVAALTPDVRAHSAVLESSVL